MLTKVLRSSSAHSAKKVKTEPLKAGRIVPCTQCYTKKWACDGEEPCNNCILRGMTLRCKHIKCRHFKKDTCETQCDLVHEGDGYANLVPFRCLQQEDGGLSPWEKLNMGVWKRGEFINQPCASLGHIRK